MDRRAVVILLALIAAEVTSALETSMVFAALKTLMTTFDRPVAVGWVVTAFLLVSAAASALCGRLGDLYGRRRVLLVALGCATVGSVISALAPNLEILILGRAVQGVAGAILPLCFGLVREQMPRDKVPLSIGIVSATAALGSGVGVMAGGAIVDLGSVPFLFVASALCGLLSFIMVLLFVRPSPGTKDSRPVDIIGGVLFVPAVTMLLLAISNAVAWHGDIRFWGLLIGGVALLLGWFRYELRHPFPLIDVRLLRCRNVAVANLCMALAGMSAFQSTMVAMMLFQQPTWTGVGLGLSATIAGSLKLPASLTSSIASPIGGHLCGTIGGRAVIVFGTAVSALGWIALSFHNTELLFAAAMFCACTLGQMMVFVAVPNIIVENAPLDRTSEATGFSNVVLMVFMAIGGQMVMTMLTTSTVSDPGQGPGTFPSAAAFSLTFAVIAALCLTAMATALALQKRNRAIGAESLGHSPA